VDFLMNHDSLAFLKRASTSRNSWFEVWPRWNHWLAAQKAICFLPNGQSSKTRFYNMLGEEDQSRNRGRGDEVRTAASWLRASFLLRAKEKIRWSRQRRPNEVSSRARAHRLNSNGSAHSMTVRIENDPEFARFVAGIPLPF
jgi:hypothetical protein